MKQDKKKIFFCALNQLLTHFSKTFFTDACKLESYMKIYPYSKIVYILCVQGTSQISCFASCYKWSEKKRELEFILLFESVLIWILTDFFFFISGDFCSPLNCLFSYRKSLFCSLVFARELLYNLLQFYTRNK